MVLLSPPLRRLIERNGQIEWKEEVASKLPSNYRGLKIHKVFFFIFAPVIVCGINGFFGMQKELNPDSWYAKVYTALWSFAEGTGKYQTFLLHRPYHGYIKDEQMSVPEITQKEEGESYEQEELRKKQENEKKQRRSKGVLSRMGFQF